MITSHNSGQPPYPLDYSPDSPRHNNPSNSSDSEEYNMARIGGGNPPNIPNPPDPPLPWLRRITVVIPGIQHPLPTHPDKLLPKFNPDNKEPAENHIDNFILVVQTLNVEHEYVVFHLFPLTFEGNESTWYFSLVQGSITNWVDFS